MIPVVMDVVEDMDLSSLAVEVAVDVTKSSMLYNISINS